MTPRTISVRFPDFATARRAIEHIELSGLDAARMDLDTDSLEHAARTSESGARDERFLSRAARKLGRGALIGAGVGLIAGLIAGVALFADGPLLGVLGAAVAATAAGGLVGAAMGGIWSHQQSPAWEETFEAPDAGEAVLHIEVHDDEQAATACEAVEEHGGTVQQRS